MTAVKMIFMLAVFWLLKNTVWGEEGKREKRYRDTSAPAAGSCDVNELAFRGTDNRWFLNPEIPFSLTTDYPHLSHSRKVATGGTLPGISSSTDYRSGSNFAGTLMTHCPDARQIRCDPETNVFHAPNYLSVGFTSQTYDKYMKPLFNYTTPREKIKCSDYVKLASYDPAFPRVPPSGFSQYEETTSRSRLVFHSMQVFGQVTDPSDTDSRECDTFWGDSKYGADPFRRALKQNPPFLCVYTPSFYNNNPQDSQTCESFSHAPPANSYEQDGSEGAANTYSHIVNPNCGSAILPNNSAVNYAIPGTEEGTDGFFQVWMAPVVWDLVYNTDILFSRSPQENELGYSGIIHKITDRFVDCEGPAAVANPTHANLCLPYKKKIFRHPLLTGDNVHHTCNIVRQLQCAPPVIASMFNEGTEPFCSFPYASGITEDKRDPWDIYCLAGDLSSIHVDNQIPSGSHGAASLWGNDFTINPEFSARLQGIKELTDNQWTLHDWTPVYTSPPLPLTCPPPRYLVVELVGEVWMIRSIIQPTHFQNMIGEIAPFVDPLVAWEVEWPSDLPPPDGPDERPEGEGIGREIITTPNHNSTQYRQAINFRDYLLSGRFKKMVLTTERARKAAATASHEKRLISSPAAEDPEMCGTSESARHYGASQHDYAFWSRGGSMKCTYDFRMFYEHKEESLTPEGRGIKKTPILMEREITLEYRPRIFPDAMKDNPYFPAGGEGSPWSHVSKVSYADESQPEARVFSEHRCRSATGAVSDCVVKTTHNIYGEAAFVARNTYRGKGAHAISVLEDFGPAHFNRESFFIDGICATPGISTGDRAADMGIIGLPSFCHEPRSFVVDKWYHNVLGISDKEKTWRRQLADMSEDFEDEEGPMGEMRRSTDLKSLRSRMNYTTETEGRAITIHERKTIRTHGSELDADPNISVLDPPSPVDGMICPPEQLITCDHDYGWIVLSDSRGRWRFVPEAATSYVGDNLTPGTKAKLDLCPDPHNRYLIYLGLQLADITLVSLPEFGNTTDIHGTLLAAEGANVRCVYKLMYRAKLPEGLDSSGSPETYERRVYLRIAIESTGYIVDARKFLRTVLANNTKLLLSTYTTRLDDLMSLKKDHLDQCTSTVEAAFKNYSDPTQRKCSCLGFTHHGTGCVCGGGSYLEDSPFLSGGSSDSQDGRFAYLSQFIPPDTWNTAPAESCYTKEPDFQPRTRSARSNHHHHTTSDRLHMNVNVTLSPFSTRFMCPTPGLMRCTDEGFYAIDNGGDLNRGRVFQYVPGSLRANYQLDPLLFPSGEDENTTDSSSTDWTVKQVPPFLAPYTCWAPRSGRVPTATRHGGHKKATDHRLQYTAESPPQIEITFAEGSGKKKITDLRCKYILVAPQCQSLLSFQTRVNQKTGSPTRVWTEPPTVSFSLQLKNPSVAWLDTHASHTFLNFHEKCAKHPESTVVKGGPYYRGDTYLCPGLSGWCGSDIGLRVISDTRLGTGIYDDARNSHEFCCERVMYDDDKSITTERLVQDGSHNGFLAEPCVSDSHGAFVPWWSGTDHPRGEKLHKELFFHFSNSLGGSASQQFACNYMFGNELTGVVPVDTGEFTENDLMNDWMYGVEGPSGDFTPYPLADEPTYLFPYHLRSVGEEREHHQSKRTPPVSPTLRTTDSLFTCAVDGMPGTKKNLMEEMSTHGHRTTKAYISETIDSLISSSETEEKKAAVLPRPTGCPDPMRDFACEDNTLKLSSRSYHLLNTSNDPCVYQTACLGESVYLGIVDAFRSSEVQWALTNVTIHFATEAAYYDQTIPPAVSHNLSVTGATIHDWLYTHHESLGPYTKYSVVCEYAMYRNPLLRDTYPDISNTPPECPLENVVIVGPVIIPSLPEEFLEFHERVNKFSYLSLSRNDYFETPFIPVKLLSLADQRKLVDLSGFTAYSFDYDPDSNSTDENAEDEPRLHIPLPGWESDSGIHLHRHLLAELPEGFFPHVATESVLRSFPLFCGRCRTAFGRYLDYRRARKDDPIVFTDEDMQNLVGIFIPAPCSSFSHTTFVCDCPFFDIKSSSPLFSNVATSCAAELSSDTARTTGRVSAASGGTGVAASETQKKGRKHNIIPRERTTCPYTQEIRTTSVVSGINKRTVFKSISGFSRCLVYQADDPPGGTEHDYVQDCLSPTMNTTALISGDDIPGKEEYARLQFAQASIHNGATLYCTYAFQNAAPRTRTGGKRQWYMVRYKSDQPYNILPIHYHSSLVYPTAADDHHRTYSGGWTSGSVCAPDFTTRNPSVYNEIYDYHKQWFPCTAVCGDVGVGEYIPKKKEERINRTPVEENGELWPRWQQSVDVCSCPVARMDSSVVLERDDYVNCREKYAPSTVHPAETVKSNVVGDFWFREGSSTNTATDLDPSAETTLDECASFQTFTKQNKRPLIHTCPLPAFIDAKIIPTLPFLTSNVLNGPAKSRTSFQRTPAGGYGASQSIFSDDRHEVFVLDAVTPVSRERAPGAKDDTRFTYKSWNGGGFPDHEAYATVATIDYLSRPNMTRFFRSFMCGDRPIDFVMTESEDDLENTVFNVTCKKKGRFVGAQVTLTTGISSLDTILAPRSSQVDSPSSKEKGRRRDVAVPSGGTLFCTYAYDLTITSGGLERERKSMEVGGLNRSFRYPREALVTLKSTVGDHYSPPAMVWKIGGGSTAEAAANRDESNPELVGSYYNSRAKKPEDSLVNHDVRAEDFWTLVYRRMPKTIRGGTINSHGNTVGSSYWVAECGINLHAIDASITDEVFHDYAYNNPCSCQLHMTNGDSRLQYEWDYRTEIGCVNRNAAEDLTEWFSTHDYHSCMNESLVELINRFSSGLPRGSGGLADNLDYPSLLFRLTEWNVTEWEDTDENIDAPLFPELLDIGLLDKLTNIEDENPTLSLSTLMKEILYYNTTVESTHGFSFFNSKVAEWIQTIFEGGRSDLRTDASTTCMPPQCLSAMLSNNYIDKVHNYGFVCLEKPRSIFLHDISEADPYAELPDFMRFMVAHEPEANDLHGFIHASECVKHQRPRGIIEDLLSTAVDSSSTTKAESGSKTKHYAGEDIIFRGARVLVPRITTGTTPEAITEFISARLDHKMSGELCPVVACEYYDAMRDMVIQLQSFVSVPKTDHFGTGYTKSIIRSYIPRLYEHLNFWRLRDYMKDLPGPSGDDTVMSVFKCSPQKPSRSVCHCPLILLSTEISPWDGCVACGGSNGPYGELDSYSASGNYDKFSSSSCTLATQPVETSVVSFIGLCGFLRPNRTTPSQLADKSYEIKARRPHYFESKTGDDIYTDDPRHHGRYVIKDEFRDDVESPLIPIPSDRFLAQVENLHQLIENVENANSESDNGLCTNFTDSDFYQYLVPGSLLQKYFHLIADGSVSLGNTKNPTSVIHESPLSLGFTKYTCPPVEWIDFSALSGFHVKQPYTAAWAFTQFEHGLQETRLFEEFPPSFITYPTGWAHDHLYHSLSSMIGVADVDMSSVRFIGAYEHPLYQCKYLFHTSASLATPHSGLPFPYHSIPHYFFLSPRVQGIEGLISHACRRSLKNGDGTFIGGMSDSSVSPCYLILDETNYPTLAEFINNVSTLLLCHSEESRTSSLPKNFYQIYNEFVELASGLGLPSAATIAANYEHFIEAAASTHPSHKLSKGVKYCRGNSPDNCPLVSPLIPHTNKGFVSYSRSNWSAVVTP